MAEPNAAVIAALAGFAEWNINLITLSSDNKALFDDELAANTTYQLRAVNIKDPYTVVVGAVCKDLQSAVNGMSTTLTSYANKKFATAKGSLSIAGYAYPAFGRQNPFWYEPN